MLFRSGVDQWVTLDNTDQTTENGILFADARWATTGDIDPVADDFKLEDQGVLKKEHQKKLLAMLKFVKNEDRCRLVQVYEYFGHKAERDCGHCDVCRK